MLKFNRGRCAPVGSVFEGLEGRVLLSAVVVPLSGTVAPMLLIGQARGGGGGDGPNVTNPTPSGYTPSQISSAYGFTGSGAGQTIAIVDAYNDTNIASDLKVFDAQFGLSNNDSKGNFVLTVHKMTSNVPNSSGWSLEIALDVEWAHAMAPGADILLVEAQSPSIGNLLAR